MGIGQLFTQTASVETCTGQAPSPTYSAAVNVACFAQSRQETARDKDGYHVPTSMTVFASIADADRFVYGSKLTVDGHAGYVVAAYPFRHGPASAHHVKVMVI